MRYNATKNYGFELFLKLFIAKKEPFLIKKALFCY